MAVDSLAGGFEGKGEVAAGLKVVAETVSRTGEERCFVRARSTPAARRRCVDRDAGKASWIERGRRN